MSILNKLVPNPTSPESGIPPSGTQAEVNVLQTKVQVVEKVLGISAPKPPFTNPVIPSRVPLTTEESALLGRAMNFIGPAMKRHGISLTADETKWIGAEVADFVQSEAPKVPTKSGFVPA